MRQERLASVVAARSQDQRGDQRRGAGVDVHHRAAGEVERPERPEPAAPPDPVADRGVDQQSPETAKATKAPKRMRSTTAPEIRATVRIAKVPW